MSEASVRTVVFADLRGSTALYESLGNAEATTVVTHSVSVVGRLFESHGGRIVKTLGDGLMAVFPAPLSALLAAEEVHDSIDRILQQGPSADQPVLRVQMALAHGELIDMAGDCFGDAVNVCARLLDLAGDNETLVTAQTRAGLPPDLRERFRRLDRMHLRGRLEPVEVWRFEAHKADAASTMFGDALPTAAPEGIRLSCAGVTRIHSQRSLPVVIGRSHDANYCMDDSRVSRLHARLEWHGGSFQLVDMSSNGTFVRFGQQSEYLTLMRGACTLHGRGTFSLGVNPEQSDAPVVHFEVLRFEDTGPTTIL